VKSEDVAVEETRVKTHTSALWSTCCICRTRDRCNSVHVLRLCIPDTKPGIQELEKTMFSEMGEKNIRAVL